MHNSDSMKTIPKIFRMAVPIIASILIGGPYAQTAKKPSDNYGNLSFSSGLTKSVEKVSSQIGITPNNYSQTNAFSIVDNNQDGKFTSTDSLYSIVEANVTELGKTINLKSTNPKIMTISDAYKLYLAVAVDYLAKEGYNPQYGARPLKRLIQTKLLNPIASLIISEGILRGGTVIVDIKNNDISFDVKKGKKGMILERELVGTSL